MNTASGNSARSAPYQINGFGYIGYQDDIPRYMAVFILSDP